LDNTFISRLKKRYTAGLPGKDVQLKLAHGARLDFGRDLTAPKDAKLSAVLICLYPKMEIGELVTGKLVTGKTDQLPVTSNQLPQLPVTSNQLPINQLTNTPIPNWHVVLIERVSRSNDRHAGQISFPGGKYDAADKTLYNCALREASEEVGLDPKKVHKIGQLTDLYIPVSGFHVTPFLVYCNEPIEWKAQPTEVNKILEPSLQHLLDPNTLQLTDLWIAEHITLNYVPYYDVEGKKVWGATAMILSELLTMVAEAQL
jgi:8-oxo-dGTP pyrophosphatase MutT (NUDIX family)